MDVFPKFIVERDPELGDCLVVSKCTYHRQLACDAKNVVAGGWWSLDSATSTFTLYGGSTEFGPADVDMLSDCVRRGAVYRAYMSAKLEGYKFLYRASDGMLTDLSKFEKHED